MNEALAPPQIILVAAGDLRLARQIAIRLGVFGLRLHDLNTPF